MLFIESTIRDQNRLPFITGPAVGGEGWGRGSPAGQAARPVLHPGHTPQRLGPPPQQCPQTRAEQGDPASPRGVAPVPAWLVGRREGG